MTDPNARLQDRVSQEEFPYDNWLEAVKALAGQFEQEEDDLEATLEGTLGFVSLWSAGPDPTRGVHTAVYQAFYDTIEEVSVDADLIEIQYGELSPEAAADAVLDQIDEHQYVSDPLRTNIRERVEDRVRQNMEADDE